MRHASIDSINPTKAAIMFGMAVKMGKINRADLDEIDGKINDEIKTLEQRLSELRGPLNGEDHVTEPQVAETVKRKPGRPAGSRNAAVTSDQVANRQLQGRYLALVRRIPKTKRDKYSKIAKADGRLVAIKEMQKALGQ
jgi:phage I-like protein